MVQPEQRRGVRAEPQAACPPDEPKPAVADEMRLTACRPNECKGCAWKGAIAHHCLGVGRMGRRASGLAQVSSLRLGLDDVRHVGAAVNGALGIGKVALARKLATVLHRIWWTGRSSSGARTRPRQPPLNVEEANSSERGQRGFAPMRSRRRDAEMVRQGPLQCCSGREQSRDYARQIAPPLPLTA